MMMMVSPFLSLFLSLSLPIVWMEREMGEEEEDMLKDSAQRAYSTFSGLGVKLTCFDVEHSEDFTRMSHKWISPPPLLAPWKSSSCQIFTLTSLHDHISGGRIRLPFLRLISL